MARYIGPKCKLARREGTDLFLKSARVLWILNVNLIQLLVSMAQRNHVCLTMACNCVKSKRFVVFMAFLERQFRRYFAEADRRKGSTGELLLQLLESRLDNVVYRMGFGSTRAEARQLVSHKAITVNGQVVNIPSFQVKQVML